MNVQRDTLLLAEIFENCQNRFLEQYELYLAPFLNFPELQWQSSFKNNKLKLDLLVCIDMLLILKKNISGGVYDVDLEKLVTNTWKKEKYVTKLLKLYKQKLFRNLFR